MTNQRTYDASTVPAALRPGLVALLYQLADDELIVGHRASEWLGLAPHIEEDVAFCSIAQDEVGHATLFYGLLHDLGEGRPDDLAFGRAAADRRNAVLVECENGDWAQTIARLLFYNVYDNLRLQSLAGSAYAPLAQAAAKILKEEKYHLLHFHTWFQRLATTTAAAKTRLSSAVAALWPEAVALFSPGLKCDEDVLAAGICTATREELFAAWLAEMLPLCEQHSLPLPAQADDASAIAALASRVPNGRRGEHTADLVQLLDTMSEVYRLDPAASW